MQEVKNQKVLLDGSRIIIESLVQSGAQAFVGYPITPANLLYAYSKQRFPIFLPASDEITALQWVTGISAAGKLPVTATSFPGFALMIETLNMAYMMELPMVIVLVQRLGPSTGSATAGAQGDVLMLRSCISGGYPIPVFCPSNFKDCWDLSALSLKTANELRTPVVLLTSKEMVMTNRSFNLNDLSSISPVIRKYYDGHDPYKPYQAAGNLVPPFVSLGSDDYLVRLNSSTHNQLGVIQKATPEAMANTKRLKQKIDYYMFKPDNIKYEYDKDDGADKIIVTYGISSEASRTATLLLRNEEEKISLLVIKSLLPVSSEIMNIQKKYKHIIFVEENLTGQMKELMYGQFADSKIRSINHIGQMITPNEIVKEVVSCR
ncbi:MAG: hypothetical protein ISR55_07415 [Bacteroidetes bacterium]|nr:hypothetical protein [Bacteroidota bacterium]MBL6963634.1 hypothetical protein [Bacteroidota bacterium]